MGMPNSSPGKWEPRCKTSAAHSSKKMQSQALPPLMVDLRDWTRRDNGGVEPNQAAQAFSYSFERGDCHGKPVKTNARSDLALGRFFGDARSSRPNGPPLGGSSARYGSRNQAAAFFRSNLGPRGAHPSPSSNLFGQSGYPRFRRRDSSKAGRAEGECTRVIVSSRAGTDDRKIRPAPQDRERTPFQSNLQEQGQNRLLSPGEARTAPCQLFGRQPGGNGST